MAYRTLACSISLLDLVAACSQLKSNIISLGASGALFGLLGNMLSELIINWTVYTNKVFIKQLSSQVTPAINVGLLPHVDNFTHIGGFHIGGFVSDFVLDFVFLIHSQFGWESQRYASRAYSTSAKPKFKFEKLESKKKKL